MRFTNSCVLITLCALTACGDAGDISIVSLHAGDDYNCVIVESVTNVGTDAGMDSGTDSGMDSGMGIDAGMGMDAGVAPDAGTDGGPAPTARGGRPLCWGNGSGRPEQPMGISEADDLVLGSGTYCARSALGWRCWGDGTRGQFAGGDPMSSVPVQLPGRIAELAIARFGGQFLCSTNDEGGLRCWGAGDRGQLGNGGVSDTAMPLPIVLSGPVRSFALGKDHACAVSGREVLCWGAGESGKNGSRSATDLLTPTPVGLPAEAITAISSDPPGPVMLVLGEAHSCLLAGVGVWCWGDDSLGQLGQVSRMSPPATVLPVPNLVVNPGGGIHSGANHVCAVSPASETTPAALRCWGDNTRKQLGTNQIEPVGPVIPMIPPVRSDQLALGRDHACAITPLGVQCWGAADQSQLDALTSIDVSAPVLVGGIR